MSGEDGMGYASRHVSQTLVSDRPFATNLCALSSGIILRSLLRTSQLARQMLECARA